MSFYVLKFGGSSVANIARIENVSHIIEDLLLQKHKLIIVVSAMQGVTNQLISLTRNFSETNSNREYDAVISSGEQASSGLLALCLNKRGICARSYQGWQIPIKTNTVFGEADIEHINSEFLKHNMDEGIVQVVSGFQGISENNDITTIGRGGSDATAVAIAHATAADECFIYTDVDGVYTADPRVVLKAQKLQSISYEEMCELSFKGAQVLQHKSVNIARDKNVKLRVLSSFATDGSGTLIQHSTSYVSKIGKIASIAHSLSSFVVNINSDDKTKLVALLQALNIESFDIDDSSLVLDKTAQFVVKQFIEDLGSDATFDNDIGTISVIGVDIKSIYGTLIQYLVDQNILLKHYSISSNCITIITSLQQTENALNVLHEFIFSS